MPYTPSQCTRNTSSFVCSHILSYHTLSQPTSTHYQGLTNCVIDAEVVAYDREKKCLLPFQVLSTRKRKVEEGDEDNQKVKVVLQLFDLIFVNGTSLLQSTLRQRRTLLHAAFREEEGFLYFASGGDHVEDG